jgi:hypothetical protein
MLVNQLLRWNIGAVTAMLVLTIAAGGGAAAQELYGSVVGSVQDGSGARIPGATIEIVKHRAERLASRGRRAGSRFLRRVRANGFHDVFWRLEQGTLSLAAGASESSLQERPPAARRVHTRQDDEHDG